MLRIVLISLTFCGFFNDGAKASEAQCASLLLKNITDQIQSTIVMALLNNVQAILDDAKKSANMEPRCPNTETISKKPMQCSEPISDRQKKSIEPVPVKPMDCAEIMEYNRSASSGVYKIWPRSRKIISPIEVFCDIEDDGGAWTLIQRRGDFDSGEDYFYKGWESYKKGFGDLKKDFWLGNDNIFALTNQRENVAKFTLTDWEGKEAYAAYDAFWTDDESHNYTLHVTGFSGTAGDALAYHNERQFSTNDQDNDKQDANCAVTFKGAWWYNNCHRSNLNGLYFKDSRKSKQDGVEWQTFRGHEYSLKDTVIKIRPRDFKRI